MRVQIGLLAAATALFAGSTAAASDWQLYVCKTNGWAMHIIFNEHGNYRNDDDQRKVADEYVDMERCLWVPMDEVEFGESAMGITSVRLISTGALGYAVDKLQRKKPGK